MIARLTKLEEMVKQSFGDEFEVSGDLDTAVERWRRLVDWAAAVHEAGGYETAVEMVIEDPARAKEANLTGSDPIFDMTQSSFRQWEVLK